MQGKKQPAVFDADEILKPVSLPLREGAKWYPAASRVGTEHPTAGLSRRERPEKNKSETTPRP